jgi:hypothetical protein
LSIDRDQWKAVDLSKIKNWPQVITGIAVLAITAIMVFIKPETAIISAEAVFGLIILSIIIVIFIHVDRFVRIIDKLNEAKYKSALMIKGHKEGIEKLLAELKKDKLNLNRENDRQCSDKMIEKLNLKFSYKEILRK